MNLRSLAALLGLGLLASGCNRFYYHPTRKIHGDAAQAGYAFAEHYFPSASGNTLHGRFFPRKAGTPRKGLWVAFHGNSRNITGTWSIFAWVTAAGWDYFVFDYSGYGRSGGRATRENLFLDGIAALEFAATAFPPSGGKLVLAGESLGGAVLLGSAAAWPGRRQAALIFVDCTFPSYEKVARATLAARWYAWPFQWLGPLITHDAHAPERGLPDLAGIPLLISHCREDETVPFPMGEALHAAAAHPKWFWPMEGCGHTRGFSARYPENRARLLRLADSLTAAPAVSGF